MAWLDTQLDAEFSLISTRRADAGLGWLTAGPDALPAALEVMVLGEFEPEVWVPSTHAAARRGTISLKELAGMEVIYGPRRTEPVTYDAWTAVLRAVNPRFEFIDPSLRCSLPVTLAFAAASNRPAAVLTGPAMVAGSRPPALRSSGPADSSGMIRVSLQHLPLTASAALVWNGDLARPLQQILFDSADSLAKPDALQFAELAS